MSDRHRVSRRASLKCLGAAGAAVVLGRAAAGAGAAEPAAGAQDEPAAKPADVAAARFGKGHNCSGAVLAAFSEPMGIDDATAVRLTSSFGGGMYVGSVCGAVTGGLMAIGLKCGGPESGVSSKAATLGRELAERFKARHRSIDCRDLTGVDLGNAVLFRTLSADMSKPENVAAAKEALGGRETRELYANCRRYVADAATIVEELIARAAK